MHGILGRNLGVKYLSLHHYRSIRIDYRQTFSGELISNWQMQNRAARRINSVTETDLWRYQQKISHYRYRSSLEFELISITDTDFGLEMS